MKEDEILIGDAFIIDLHQNITAVARKVGKISFSFYAFYELIEEDQIMTRIKMANPAFTIILSEEVVEDANWKKVGNLPPDPVKDKIKYFRQDIADPRICWLITEEPGFKQQVTPQECEALEPAVIWGGLNRVEQRLIDFVNNKPNLHVECYKVKIPGYSDNLKSVKTRYPFSSWNPDKYGKSAILKRKNYDLAYDIMNEMIDGLISLGESASESQKIPLFRKGVLAFNVLNDSLQGSLIETKQMEDLMNLFNLAATEAAIDPSKYGDGEGVASEWRDW